MSDDIKNIVSLIGVNLDEIKRLLGQIEEYENANRDLGKDKCLVGYRHQWQLADKSSDVLWCNICGKTKKLHLGSPDIK